MDLAIRKILLQSHVNEIIRLSMVNHHFNQICEDHTFWTEYYGNNGRTVPSIINLYIDEYYRMSEIQQWLDFLHYDQYFKDGDERGIHVRADELMKLKMDSFDGLTIDCDWRYLYTFVYLMIITRSNNSYFIELYYPENKCLTFSVDQTEIEVIIFILLDKGITFLDSKEKEITLPNRIKLI